MKLVNLLRFVLSHSLNRGRRVAALFRVVRWQLASRLLPEAEFSLPYVNGSRLLMTKGMVGATGNFYCGLHELDEMGFVLHVLRDGELFVDIGANVGSYTILAASIGARVVAVEPIEETHRRLTANIRVNGMESVASAHCIGLSDKPGILRFTTNEDTLNHVATGDETGPAKEVAVVTLDTRLEGRCPTLIKIDVEGHELPVLRGAKRTLECPSLLALVIETNGSGLRYGVSDAQLYELMSAAGFDAYSYSAMGRRLTRLESAGLPGVENTVFLSRANVTEIQERVSKAPKRALVNGWL